VILYNVTCKTDKEIAEEWQNWMLNTHIKEVMDTGKFISYKFCRLIEMDEEGVTFATQYYCKSSKELHEYMIHHAPLLKQQAFDKFGDKFIAFRTMLDVIDEG
jgi:hypothetical protein